MHPILLAIHRESFTPLAWFAPDRNDSLPGAAKFMILIGNAGPSMFRRYVRERGASNLTLDEWTGRVVSRLASELGAQAAFPFDSPPLPFLTWARRGGAGHVSPIGLNIHPTFGLWHAYRAALLFDVIFDLPSPTRCLHPCETCAEKPCLSACPVEAFASGSYDVDRCVDHLENEAGNSCMRGGCLARHACPIGRHFAYDAGQASFHMEAFRKSRLAARQQTV
jgi:epoxyqueuosine reductase QueG